ncbi:MAG: site-specific integrase [Halochromatium sp.]|nr:site-specific integrase [Halochromatium sp.]
MATLDVVIDAFVASREFDKATLARLRFWSEQFGTKELVDITPEDVDNALVVLAERGRLQPLRNQPTQASGKPLSGATINRYITQLGSVYRYARRLRLLPRAHVPPTKGIEKAPEPPNPERYLRPDEVERLIKVARLLDQRWGRLPALITLAFHTGLRVGNLTALRWKDVDLEAGTLKVNKTKNGRPLVAPLSASALAELVELSAQDPERLVFEGRNGRPYSFRRLWAKVCTEAGLPGRNFHQLRHGCGSAMAQAGIGQAQIMAIMGHRTLSASARYMHHSTDDKRAVVQKVFG